MHRKYLIETLENYRNRFPDETAMTSRFQNFVEKTPDCFERSHLAGHITGSAFILSPDKSSILLTHHTKLKMWIQLGGHADGCAKPNEVAFREAVEESGLTHLRFYFSHPIDLDIHEIPTYAKTPAHFHYDVRYLLISDDRNFTCSEESLALQWVRLTEISAFSTEKSTKRAVKKIMDILEKSDSIRS